MGKRLTNVTLRPGSSSGDVALNQWRYSEGTLQVDLSWPGRCKWVPLWACPRYGPELPSGTALPTETETLFR